MACSILVVRGLVESLEALGVGRAEFFLAAGFDGKRLAEQGGLVETEELDALHEVALDLSRSENLGIKMGEAAGATLHDLAGHLVARATTLRDGINTLLQLHRLLTDRQVWELREDGSKAALVCDVAPGAVRCRRFRAEVTMTALHRVLAHFEGLSEPECVAFDYAAPEYRTEYRRVFGGAERFNEPFTGIVFDRYLLGTVRFRRDLDVRSALYPHAEGVGAELSRRIPYAERVREYVVGSAPADRRNMAAVARGLGMSSRSLRRRLREEGASYVDIVQDALGTLAKHLIVHQRHSIEATAYAMGYSVPTAFHRAFKRWTGSTPAAFRAHGHANYLLERPPGIALADATAALDELAANEIVLAQPRLAQPSNGETHSP